MDRLTKREDGYIRRVCHYPENQYGDSPCYNCIDRTRCNKDLFERLALYEDMIENGELIFRKKRDDVQ